MVLGSKDIYVYSENNRWGEILGYQFEAIITGNGKDTDIHYLEELVSSYGKRFTAEVKLKDGVFDLFKILKAHKKNIAIMSEGPRDNLK